MERLAGLGPSADTSAKRKKQVVCLLTPQQSERYLKEMSEKQFHYLQKNSEYVDWRHKNEYNWINPCCTFSFSTLSINCFGVEKRERNINCACKFRAVTMVGDRGFLPVTKSVKTSYSDRKLNIKDLKKSSTIEIH